MALKTYSWTFNMNRTITKISVISTSVDEARRQVLMQLARNTVGARRKAEIDAAYAEAIPKPYCYTEEDNEKLKMAHAKQKADADELREEVEEEAETFFGNFGGNIYDFTETVDVSHEGTQMSLSDFIRHVEPKVTPFKPIWIMGVYDE